MSTKYTPITPAAVAIVLVDHQPGVMAMVSSIPAKVSATNAGTLARLGTDLNIPLLVSSTRENLDFLGTTIKDIQDAAPQAYKNRIKRAGTLNAFADPAFVKAVNALDRKHLVMAGVLTDVCLFHSVVSALQAGYEVTVAADASGTTSALADQVTYERLSAMGATISSTMGILFELFPDLGTAEGKKAEAAASHAMTAA